MASQRVQNFINEMLPYAVAVGAQYGIDPITIITQAAIETGWGDEVAGNNYFGIKSHGRPGGQVINTTEEINGKKVGVRDSFRVYDNMAQSVADYGQFLSSNPRYAGALQQQGYKNQLQGITGAGYATDSNYSTLVDQVSDMVARNMRPLPPGSIPNVVASQIDVTPPAGYGAKPVSQSPTLARERSLISPDASSPLKAALARLASSAARSANAPVPASVEDRVTARNKVPVVANTQRANGLGDELGLSPISGGLQKAPLFDAMYDTRTGNMVRVAPIDSQGIAVGSTKAPAPIPASVEDRVTARNRAIARGTLPAIPPSTLGMPPTTRVVQSVPVRSGLDGIGSAPSFGALQSFNARPPFPVTQSADMQLMRNPAMNPFLGQQQSAAAQVAGRPNNAVATALSTQQPLRVTVNYGNNPVAQALSQPNIPQGFTDTGNGKLVSNETGGVYYTRHLL